MSPSEHSRWPAWRIVMLVGSLLVVGNAVADVRDVSWPRFVHLGLAGSGYALLIIGFWLAMGARRR